LDVGREAIRADTNTISVIIALFTEAWAGLAGLVRCLEVVSSDSKSFVAVALRALGGSISLYTAFLAVGGAGDTWLGSLRRILGIGFTDALVTDNSGSGILLA